MRQMFLNSNRLAEQLMQILQGRICHRFMLVAGKSFSELPIRDVIESTVKELGIELIRFSDFSPNPSYEEVILGVECYRQQRCEGILAVGGGSAIDVAKCIKLFSPDDMEMPYLNRKIRENNTLLIAVPTTAGSGSESTQFAVIYKDGEKYSVDSEYALPQYVILDETNLFSLPLQIKRSTAGDALSHAIESFWSLRASGESKAIAQKAMSLILKNMDAYWHNEPDACRNVLEGANLAGQAINMTKTTAAHAMCYKFTSLFGVPHGHAVMLCLPEVWQYMQEHMNACRDVRGEAYLADTLDELAGCLGKTTPQEAISFLKFLRKELGFVVPKGITDEQIKMMANSVNEQRLNNFPVTLSQQQIGDLYKQIIRGNIDDYEALG